MESQAFTEWLNSKGVSPELLKWQQGKTLRETWDTCQRGDWLEWLLRACGYQWTDSALAEYYRVTALAWAEYKRVTAPAWAEYKRVTAPAWAKYKRVTAPAWAKCQRVTAPAWAEYQRVKATTIRMLIHYPLIELDMHQPR